MAIRLEPVETIHHPLLVEAMRICHEAFPQNEQMSVPFWLETLLALPHPKKRLLIFTSDERPGEALGMAFVEINAPAVAYLAYFCTRHDLRGQGIGAAAYRQLTAALFGDGFTAVVLEVELPETGETAARRIHWYRRHGAKLLDGVRWIQTVDNGSDGLPMRLMVHAREAVSAREAYRLACIGLGTQIETAGELALG